MRRLVICIIISVLAKTGVAQVNYSQELIPKSLLPYANAVVRNNEVTIQVLNFDNTVYHVKNAITILNKNGDDKARIVIWHNKSNQIKYVRGLVYDEYGKQIAKFSESNFQDENAGNDFSLFEDSRVKYFIPAVVSYPYTVEYEYEVRSKQTLNFNSWHPINKTGMAVEKSTYTFICKPDFKIRYKELNLPEKVVIGSNKEGATTYTWHVDNLKAVRDEPYSPDPDTYLSSVMIAPESFSYGGIKGSFTNWNELGKWIYDKLLFERDQLSPATVAHIKEITKDVMDPKQKAKIIYEYVQQKTRYVSVQIGIGGYQPVTASEVDDLSYGDCKGLVNYTYALLKAVGIESYYCQVEAGDQRKSMLPDFASMDQGNHVILCIPFKNDTTWLECTSQKIPFGFLGTFTGNRTVLACTPQGGKLLHTPNYYTQNNTQIRTAKFTISPAGQLAGSMNTLFKGVQYDNREDLIDESVLDQGKGLKKVYPINNLDIESFSFSQNKSEDPKTIENIKFTARDYASINNDKIFFLINPVNRTVNVPRDVKNRLNKVYINYGYTDEDELEYTLPSGYRLEKSPLNITVKKPFGTYTATMRVKDGVLTYNRKIKLIDGTYPKDIYPDLIDFYQNVVDADNYNVMLVKTTN